MRGIRTLKLTQLITSSAKISCGKYFLHRKRIPSTRRIINSKIRRNIKWILVNFLNNRILKDLSCTDQSKYHSSYREWKIWFQITKRLVNLESRKSKNIRKITFVTMENSVIIQIARFFIQSGPLRLATACFVLRANVLYMIA